MAGTGMAVKLGGTIASSPFGKLRDYEGTNAGTIFLWDAGLQNDGAVPANGATLTNLVRKQGALTTGLTEAQMDATVQNNSGTYLATERTSKGGIHAAYSQAGGQTAATAAFALNPTSQLRDWIGANSDAGADYGFMVSLWLRRTRAGVSGGNQALSWFAAQSSATNNYLWHMQNGIMYPTGAPGLIGPQQNVPSASLDTPLVAALATQGWLGTKPNPINGANTAAVIANVGPNGPWQSLAWNKAESYVLYRAQIDIINLADVGATGADLVTKQAAILSDLNAMLARDFAAGGRFAGDTYTPAATLKP